MRGVPVDDRDENTSHVRIALFDIGTNIARGAYFVDRADVGMVFYLHCRRTCRKCVCLSELDGACETFIGEFSCEQVACGQYQHIGAG